MNKTNPYPHFAAAKVAAYIIKLLRPHCLQIHLAGSLRRMRPYVHDIEIVCQPLQQLVARNLLGEEIFETSQDFNRALETVTLSITRGHTNGRMMQIVTSSKICPGIKLDLFMPQPPDYYRQYAIRTGSAEYARLIANTWVKKGWCGTDDGLRKRNECTQKKGIDKTAWHCTKAKPTLPPVWQSEGDFFSWLGLEYIDPEFREIHSVINTAQ